MIDDCMHRWSEEGELCETTLGNIHSPVCVHCGSVKLLEEARAGSRRRAELAARPINLPAVRDNMPPASAGPVHPFQGEFFTNV